MPIEMLYAAQKGDADAQDRLMHLLYQPVYHFVFKRTGNSEVAVDLCQNVFLKCFQALDSYDARLGSVRTWVFRIARNTLYDHYRRHAVERFDEQHEEIADARANTAHRTEARLMEEYVARLLSMLPDVEADVVTLKAIREMTYEEVARIIGKSEVATRKIYSRALGRLREHTLRQQRDEI